MTVVSCIFVYWALGLSILWFAGFHGTPRSPGIAQIRRRVIAQVKFYGPYPVMAMIALAAFFWLPAILQGFFSDHRKDS